MAEQGSLFGPPARDTLAEARRQVEHGRADGVTCPCCGQFAKTYRRKLNSSMAYALLVIARRTDDWFHLFDFLAKQRVKASDAPSLRHWGLIEEKGEGKDDGNPRAGFYRVTELGRAFAGGRASVPRHMLIYNDQLLGFSEERIAIREALGDRFDYDELMSEPGIVDGL